MPKDLIRLFGGMVAHASVINAGKCAVMKPSLKPQEKNPKKSIENVGSFTAFTKASPSFSFGPVSMFVLFGLIANRHKSVAKTIIARTANCNQEIAFALYCQFVLNIAVQKLL